MIARRSNVARITDWLFGGVTYSVYVGLAGAIQGWMVLCAVGPHRDYRSVSLAAHEATQALSTVFASQDPARRADSAECLLGLSDILLGNSGAMRGDEGR